VWVEQSGVYPSHRPLLMNINIRKVYRTTKQIEMPTNFAELFEEKLKKDIEEARTLHEEKQHEEGGKRKAFNENDVREASKKKLQHLMKTSIERRHARLRLAQEDKDTTRQWQLIAAAVEEANIEYHHLRNEQATKMRGRSKVTFKTTTRYAFKGAEAQADEEQVTRLQMLNAIAAQHSVLGNKLKSISKRMVTTERNRSDPKKQKENRTYNEQTLASYRRTSSKAAKKQELSEAQRKQIIGGWQAKRQVKPQKGKQESDLQSSYNKQVD